MKHNLNVEGHLNEELLIRLLDGEVDKSSASSATRHLDVCWTCRQRKDQIRQAMDRFVEFEEALTCQSVAAPPRAWAGFHTRLRETAAVIPPSASRPAMEYVRPLGVLGLTSALIFSLIPARPVSAKEILEKSEASEANALNTARNPLVVQQLRVESSNRAASWSLWNAPAAGRFRQSWESRPSSSLPAELKAVYSNPGLDAQHPLSAANHARWRDSLTKHTESVVEEGGGVLRVFTYNQDQPADGQITEAQLWVRTSDWRPIAESFKVADTGATREYRIVETAFHVEPLTTENARIFEEERQPGLEPQRLPVLHHPAEIAGARPFDTSVTPLEPAANLAETEVEVLALLHGMDADRSESAEVIRGASTVQVTAYAATEERKNLIASRVSAVPNTSVTIHLLSEASSKVEAAPSVTPSAPAERESPLFLKALIQQSGSSANANQAVVRQMDLLQQIAIEMNAVENLAGRFPDPVRASLSGNAREQLDRLVAEHLDTARKIWRDQREGAAPLVSAIGMPAAAEANQVGSLCGEWNRPELGAGQAAWRLEELYARAFTTTTGVAPSDMSQETLRDEAKQLRSKLADLLVEGCLR